MDSPSTHKNHPAINLSRQYRGMDPYSQKAFELFLTVSFFPLKVGKGCCSSLKAIGCNVIVSEVDPICALQVKKPRRSKEALLTVPSESGDF